jgi:hypothetical protein
MHDDDLIGAPPRKRSPLVGMILLLFGAILVAAGIVLGPVPVVPGFPLVVLGLLLMGLGSDRARGWINRSERQLPDRLRRPLRAARDAFFTRRAEAPGDSPGPSTDPNRKPDA